MYQLRPFVILANLCLALAQDVDYAQFVNPFIGSEGAITGYACKVHTTYR